MSTIFRFRRKEEGSSGSGGKIMRGRRLPDVKSPYARPAAAPAAVPVTGSPNRLLGLISPASRIITGAAKMISTVFFPDSPQTSSEEEESDDDDDIASQGDGRLNENEVISEADIQTEENLQLNIPKNEIKLAIEHLITQETFSSAECSKLVNILESRVVELPASTSQSAAVMEARKWLEEKKMESHSQLDKNQGSFRSSPYMPSNITDGEQGSPVIMAKSYMKSRPPWASPTIGQFGFKTSPIGMSTSLEEPHSLSSSKDLKRNSLAMDSLTDGSKRVRFKSTDQTAQPVLVHDSHKDVLVEERDDGMGEESAQITVTGTTHLTEDVFLDTHDGPPDQSADIVSSEVRQTTSKIKPAIQSDSNDLAQLNGTNELVTGGSQRHQQFAPTETKSFDVKGNTEQPRSPTVNNNDNALGEGNLAINNDQQFETETQNPRIIAVFAPWRDIHQIQDTVSDSHNKSLEITTPRSHAELNEKSTARYSKRNQSREENNGKQTANNGSMGNRMEVSCELSEASIQVPSNPSNPSNEEVSNIASGSLNSSSRQAAAKESQSISSPRAKRRVTTARGVDKEKENPVAAAAVAVKNVGRYARRGVRGRGRGKLT